MWRNNLHWKKRDPARAWSVGTESTERVRRKHRAKLLLSHGKRDLVMEVEMT